MGLREPNPFQHGSCHESSAGTRLDASAAMRLPKFPVERSQTFTPRFCPWPACAQHTVRAAGFRFRRHGSYSTRKGASVPRFRCSVCGRSFSRQSFAVSYYMKRAELLVPVAAGLQAGSPHRQLARSLGCAHSTVARLRARLGQHAMLLTCRSLVS